MRAEMAGHNIITLKDSQILQIANQIQAAQTQADVQLVESYIKQHISIEKNTTTLTGLILSSDHSPQTRQALISMLNLITQHLLEQYQVQKNTPSYYHGKDRLIDENRRNILNLCLKIEKIIFSAFFPANFKPNLVCLQLKVYSRSRDEWERAGVESKMDFCLRKDAVAVGGAYFQNILKLGFTVQQKMSAAKRLASFIPLFLAKFIVKIINKQGSAQTLQKPSAYSNLSTCLNLIDQIFSISFTQVLVEIVASWCSTSSFIAALTKMAEQLQQSPHQHPNKYFIEWQEILPKIISKIAKRIVNLKSLQNFSEFLKLFCAYSKHLWKKHCLGKDIIFENEQILGLLEAAVKIAKYDGMYQLRSCLIGQSQPLTQVLNTNQKYFLLHQYVFKIGAHFQTKISAEISNLSNGKTIIDELLQYSKVLPEEPDSFTKTYSQLFFSLCKSFPPIISFVKNLIYCFLSLYESPSATVSKKMQEEMQSCFVTFTSRANIEQEASFNIDKCWWLKEQLQITRQLLKKFDPEFLVGCGMILAVFGYRFGMTDRWLLQYINEFVEKAVKNMCDKNKNILINSPITASLFLILFQSYLDELPLCIRSTATNRIINYPLTPLLQQLSFILSGSPPPPPLLSYLLLNSIISYINSIKKLLQSQKISPIYQRYTSLEFPELLEPYAFLLTIIRGLPFKYQVQIFKDILDCQVYVNIENYQSTRIDTLRSIIGPIVQHQEQSHIGNYEYQCKIFNILKVMIRKSDYSDLFSPVFQWVHSILSKHGIVPFQQHVIQFCIQLLTSPHTLCSLSYAVKQQFWEIVHPLILRYKWKAQTTDLSYGESGTTKQIFDLTDYAKSQLFLIYLMCSQPDLPLQILSSLLQKVVGSLQFISQAIAQKKRIQQICKYRPFQLQQVCFVLCAHQLTTNPLCLSYLPRILSLVTYNLTYRKQYHSQFNYIHGKYSLLIMLILKYWPVELHEHLQSNSSLRQQIYVQVFYHQNLYRVQYDMTVYILTAVDLVRKILGAGKVSYYEQCVKFVHIMICNCVLFIDRMYKNNSTQMQEGLQIKYMEIQGYSSLKQVNQNINQFINYLTRFNPQTDEFEYFSNFMLLIRSNAKVYQWFDAAISIYAKAQVHMERYYQVYLIRKIKKSTGIIVYRVVRKVGYGDNTIKGWRRNWRDAPQFDFFAEKHHDSE